MITWVTQANRAWSRSIRKRAVSWSQQRITRAEIHERIPSAAAHHIHSKQTLFSPCKPDFTSLWGNGRWLLPSETCWSVAAASAALPPGPLGGAGHARGERFWAESRLSSQWEQPCFHFVLKCGSFVVSCIHCRETGNASVLAVTLSSDRNLPQKQSYTLKGVLINVIELKFESIT